VDKVAHLPELRFALGEPEVETTSIDNAATALETASFFIRKVGTDGFRVHHQATLKKVVSDRRASLDEETEIKPTIRKLVETQFARGANIPIVAFPEDSSAIQDSPRLTLVLVEPETEWKDGGQLSERISQWTKDRGKSPRLYPGSLVWCAKKQGRELREFVELWLAWRRVAREVAEGVLGAEFDRTDRAEVQAKVKDAEEAAKDEVWSGYRFVALSDSKSGIGLKAIDLGAGHASASETLCGRILGALKTEALLNESVGAGYIDRHWPPALKETGAWPLTSLRQSFLNGTLTRLVEPDSLLRRKIVEFVERGDFGLASGTKNGGAYERVWYGEPIAAEEVAFEPSVFLLTKAKAEQLKSPTHAARSDTPTEPKLTHEPRPPPGPAEESIRQEPDGAKRATLHLIGDVPPEIWNRLGTKILPKLRSGDGLRVGIDFSVSVEPAVASNLEKEIKLILKELSLDQRVRVERG
jgi:hypothetical protein